MKTQMDQNAQSSVMSAMPSSKVMPVFVFICKLFMLPMMVELNVPTVSLVSENGENLPARKGDGFDFIIDNVPSAANFNNPVLRG